MTSPARLQHYSELAISTVLILKRVFSFMLRAEQGFIDSIFTLMKLPLRCPDYSCVSRRAKSVNIPFKTPTRGEIAHLVIDSTGLKVFGEGEWKVKKHSQEKRRVWRKMRLAVDADTHEVFCADLSLNNVTDAEAFPGLIRQTHGKLRSLLPMARMTQNFAMTSSGEKNQGACPSTSSGGLLAGGVCGQKSGCGQAEAYREQFLLERYTAYNWRSVAETAMYWIKQLFGGHLTLRDYDAQVGEAMTMIRALNKMTRAGMPESLRIA